MREMPIARTGLKTPRAAAVAGLIFAVLLLASLTLLFQSVPARPTDPGEWLVAQTWKVSLALNLVPFAGVAFLWFVGVLRDKLGPAEDRLFATVFLGSGLLFAGLLFVAASVLGAILIASASASADFAETPSYRFARSLVYYLFSIYALKMAAVFMITASTMIVRTGFTARWTAIFGYTMAGVILVGSQAFDWTLFLLPLWVLCVSAAILVEEFRRARVGGPLTQCNGGDQPSALSISKDIKL
ncbi:MAG: conserved rane protein of unknown function [Hyphomicrobiales bacterium]|nr:conserved rane protein of unknown function [Hyphomicrobiales bacterium]